MKGYLDGAATQLIERAQRLIGLIPRNLPRDVSDLELVCRGKIDKVVQNLGFLASDPVMQLLDNQLERLRFLRNAVEELDFVETVGIAALYRWNDQDDRLNRLIDRIRREIGYPLPAPVVACTSGECGYYHIYPPLNLLRVPLAEGLFLLHLPDLYHELGHPLLLVKNDPQLDAIQREFVQCVTVIQNHFANELAVEERRRGPDSFAWYINAWMESWTSWGIEMFCDLFAVCTVGPAFAWAHYHLVAQSASFPFDVPKYASSSHPADAARMAVLLKCLRTLGFEEEVVEVSARWDALLKMLGAKATPEYARCFPDKILNEIVTRCISGVKGIGCRVVSPDMDTRNWGVGELLNDAWRKFWESPTDYVKWEKQAVQQFA